jgi:hypothetical protein
METDSMKEGDYAGLAVFQYPICVNGVKVGCRREKTGNVQ